MRTLVLGVFGGLASAAITIGVLATTEAVPPPDQVLAVLIVAAAVALMVWALGALLAFRRWIRGAVRRRRARKQRRRDLAVVRASARVNEFQSTEDEATVLLDDLPRARTASLSRTQITNALRDAESATQRGDFRAAADLYSDVIDGAPDHVDAHLARGRVHLDLGDYNRAMSDFVAAEDLEPDSPEPPIAMGELYFARKDYARAIGCFDIALGLAPEHAMAHCRRGLSYFYRKNYPLALEDLFRARSLDAEIPYIDAHIAATQRKVKEEKPKAKRR